MNTSGTLNVLAGAVDPGTGGTAQNALFTTYHLASSFPNPQSFIVSEHGVVSFSIAREAC